MPPLSTPPVPIGTRVELHSLKAKPQLNGHCGVVVGYVESSGKCIDNALCIVVLEGAGGENTAEAAGFVQARSSLSR